MIVIDTDVLKGLSEAARSAEAQLAEAAQLLNQITEHHDWGCKERVVINEKISRIRSQIGKLFQDSQSFTSVLGQISDEFVSEENSISQMFEGVESLIGNILSVPVETGSFSGIIPDWEGSLDDMSDGSGEAAGFPLVEQLKKGPFSQMIQVADFNSLLEGRENVPH